MHTHKNKNHQNETITTTIKLKTYNIKQVATCNKELQ